MKRIFVVLTLFIASSLAFPFQSFAQAPTPGPWYNQGPTQFHDRVFGTPTTPVPENEIFGERYTYAQINWILNSLANIFSFGIHNIDDVVNIIRQILASKTNPTFNQFAQLGAPGIILGSISEIYSNPPASGIDSVQSTLAKLDIAQPVMAQGGSYNSSSALYFLWSASRNTAYLIMVVLLIASGFLIMFRVKVNPQTVVSLQLMIPKLIVTLLLVTFSFAIAGLVIDCVYLIIAFLMVAFSQSGVFPAANLQNAIALFTGPNMRNFQMYFIIPLVVTVLASALLVAAGVIATGTIIGSIIGITAIVGGSLAAIFSFILMLAIVWILFKLWWMLLKTYITLMLLVVVGPWQIMLGLLPGQAGFGAWFRNIVANASVFVVAPLMLFFAMVFWSPFTNWFVGIIQSMGPTAAPLVGVFAPLGQINGGGIGGFPVLPIIGGGGLIFNFAIGYAVLALTPKIADIVRDTLKVPPFKYGSAIGQPLGYIKNPLQSGASAYTDTMTRKALKASDNFPTQTTQIIDALRYMGVVKGRPGT